jgi:phage shock protein A
LYQIHLRRIALNNGTEEWFEFCTKEDALAYVERGWCTTEDVVKHWPEKNSNNEVTLSEMEERMESIEDSIESFNDNLATLMEAIKTLTQQRESSILQQNAPAVTEKLHSQCSEITTIVDTSAGSLVTTTEEGLREDGMCESLS